MADQMNRMWLVADYPEGEPTAETFTWAEELAPEAGPGEIVVRNLWLSVDPYMRGRLTQRSPYASPVPIGEVMTGSTVSQVVASNSHLFRVGDIILTQGGWQDYCLLSAAQQDAAYRVGPDLPLSTALGVAGTPGATAYFGLLKLGRPREGETLVVSAAAGAVGSIVGQIGRLHGCRVVGIEAGAEKCALCIDAYGFDACVDYNEADLPDALADACPDGIDVYFENVGGPVLAAVAPLLKDGSRAPICSFLSQYTELALELPWDVINGLGKQIESRFFLVSEWVNEFPRARRELTQWVRAGDLTYREAVTRGLEGAPEALAVTLAGDNLGKQVVRIAAPA